MKEIIMILLSVSKNEELEEMLADSTFSLETRYCILEELARRKSILST